MQKKNFGENCEILPKRLLAKEKRASHPVSSGRMDEKYSAPIASGMTMVCQIKKLQNGSDRNFIMP